MRYLGKIFFHKTCISVCNFKTKWYGMVRSLTVAFVSCRTWREQQDAGAFSHSVCISDTWRSVSSADTDVLPGCGLLASTLWPHGFFVEAPRLGVDLCLQSHDLLVQFNRSSGHHTVTVSPDRTSRKTLTCCKASSNSHWEVVHFPFVT